MAGSVPVPKGSIAIEEKKSCVDVEDDVSVDCNVVVDALVAGGNAFAGNVAVDVAVAGNLLFPNGLELTLPVYVDAQIL